MNSALVRRLCSAAVCTFVLLPALVLPAFASLPDANPAVVQFDSDLSAYPQNFAIATDRAGYVYLGNAEGVQIFDGESWQLQQLPNKEIVRSLAFDGDSRVYAGGFGEFGYLERAPDGTFAFVSLLERFPDPIDAGEFGSIWNIQVSSAGVFFVADTRLLFLDPRSGRTAHWTNDAGFGAIGVWRDQVYLQWIDKGLRSFASGNWQAQEDAALEDGYVEALLPLSDSLLVIAENGWYRFDGSDFTEIDLAGDIPWRDAVTRAFVVGDGQIGLATHIGVLVFVDLKSLAIDQVRVAQGFVPDAVLSPRGQVLAANDLGFSATNWPTRWRAIDTTSGLVGTVQGIRRVSGTTYALTSSGVFASGPDSKVFERLDWTDYEAWDLLELDSGELLLADSFDIFLLSPGVEPYIVVADAMPLEFLPSRFDPDLIYVGTDYGVLLLRRSEDGWRGGLRFESQNTPLTVSMVERAPSELWVGSERGGVQRLRIDEARGEVDARRFGEGDGLYADELTRGAFVAEVNGELLATTDRGLFRYDGERFHSHRIGNSEAVLSTQHAPILSAQGNQLWALGYDRVFRLGTDGRWIEEKLRRLARGAFDALEFHGDKVLVGAMGHILVYDASVQERRPSAAQLKLTRAEVSDASQSLRLLALDHLHLSAADERLSLRFALSEFETPDAVRYRTQLLPNAEDFSPWSDSPQQTYVNLPPGSYRLRVQAMAGDASPVSMELPIEVHPLWYQAILFRVPSVFAAMALLLFTARYLGFRRARVLEREKAMLEQRVAERTRELQSANRQLDKMAHIDGLTQIPNRRRLDAHLDEVRRQCADQGRTLAIAIFDVDHFKQYNDSRGHLAGDALLIALAGLLSRNLRRDDDLVARFGGEEFIIVVPGADDASAWEIVESLRREVAESDLDVTVSAGLFVTAPESSMTVDAMLEAADRALYRAKEMGRNRVVRA